MCVCAFSSLCLCVLRSHNNNNNNNNKNNYYTAVRIIRNFGQRDNSRVKAWHKSDYAEPQKMTCTIEIERGALTKGNKSDLVSPYVRVSRICSYLLPCTDGQNH